MLASFVLLLPAAIPLQDAAPAPLAGVQRIVVEALAARERDLPRLRRELLAVGGEALDTLLVAASRRSLEVTVGDRHVLHLELDDELRGALLDVVAAQPRSSWCAALERLDPAWVGECARVAALDLLARAGGSADVHRLARACDLIDRPVPPDLRDSAREALAALARSGGELPWRRLWIELPGGLLPPLLDALERSRPEDALGLLTGCVGARPAADALLLERIERLLDPRDLEPRPVLVHEVRQCLARADASARLFAARVLGELGDVDVIEDLAPVIGTADARLADATHASLCRIAGEDLGRDSVAWLEWLARERHWLAGRGPELAAMLAGGSDAEAVVALRELGQHRIDRPWRSRTAALALEREPADLLVLACSKLESLGTRAERAGLEALLEHPDERVRLAAQRALRALAPRSTQG